MVDAPSTIITVSTALILGCEYNLKYWFIKIFYGLYFNVHRIDIIEYVLFLPVLKLAIYNILSCIK